MPASDYDQKQNNHKRRGFHVSIINFAAENKQ